MQTSTTRRLRRIEACAYLRDVHGICRAPSTMAKYATVGGGPRFEHAGRIPLYQPSELDRWASALLSPLKSSTSDAGLATTKPQPAGSDSALAS